MNRPDSEVWDQLYAARERGDDRLADMLDELLDRRDQADDHYPDPEPITYRAEWTEHLIDPDTLAAMLRRRMEHDDMIHTLLRQRPPGNPQVFYQDIQRDPLTPDTRALAAQWAAYPPPPPKDWHPAIRLCPYRAGRKFLGADLIIDPTLPPHSFKLNGQTFTLDR